MTETMLAIDELVDVEMLETLDGRELAGLFQRLERLRRRTEGALAAVVGEVGQRGAGLRRHNRLKNHGYRVHRDHHGHWHTYRPDGTEIN